MGESVAARGFETLSLGGFGRRTHLAVHPLVVSDGTFDGREPQRRVPRAATNNLPAQRVDELLVIEFEDLLHAEALSQDVLDHYRGGPHAYGVTLSRPREPFYLAVVAPLEVDDHRPSALGTAAGDRDVRVFRAVFLVFVAGAPGVLHQERRAALTSLCFQPLSLYRGAHQVAPLGPGAVVVAYALVTEEIPQNEPRVGRTLSYPAVGNYVVPLAEARLALVDLLQLIGALEGPVLPHGPRPRHVGGTRDVPSPEGALLRVVGHVEQLPPVLAGTPNVDHLAPGLQVPIHVLLESPYPGIVPLGNRVVGPGKGGHVLGHLAPLGLPLYPSTIHDLHVVVAEEPEHPQGVGRPPVVLVPVEDDRRVGGDAQLCHEVGEVFRVQVVTHQRIVEVLDPVYLYGVRDVSYVVEKHILIRFDYAQVLRVVQMVLYPLGTDEGVRVRVALLLYLLFRHNLSSLGVRSHDRTF